MGMFDMVRFKMKCPCCGVELNSFQTRDTACSLDFVDPWECFNMIAHCRGCDRYIELKRDQMPAIFRVTSVTGREDAKAHGIVTILREKVEDRYNLTSYARSC